MCKFETIATANRAADRRWTRKINTDWNVTALTITSSQVGDDVLLVEGGVDREAVEEEDAHDEEDVEEAEGADLDND